jgi:hypothetical protein
MEGSSPESALARIDAAIARLEAVAARAPAAIGDSGSDAVGDLAARHQALRTAVTKALGELDGLIAGAGSELSPELSPE